MGRGGLPSPRRPSSERASGTGGPGGGRSPGERRWRRMVRKAEAYLSTASVYGGGNGDGGGNLPSLPVAASSLSRKPGRRRGSPAGSSRARTGAAPGNAGWEDAHLWAPPPSPAAEGAARSSRPSPRSCPSGVPTPLPPHPSARGSPSLLCCSARHARLLSGHLSPRRHGLCAQSGKSVLTGSLAFVVKVTRGRPS